MLSGTLTIEGRSSPATAEAVRSAVAAGTFFWLDLDGLDDDAAQILGQDLHVHNLAIEDIQHFGQRPKLDDYDDVTYMVVHGAPPTGAATQEVHLLFSPTFIVTVHQGPCGATAEVHAKLAGHPISDVAPPQYRIMYLTIDALVDGFFPVLSAMDDQIDQLEDDILVQPTEAQLKVLFGMKRQLVMVHKVVSAQRDLFARMASQITTLPGLTEEAQRYFRDLYDHMIRINDLVDGYRDLLSGVMDTHLSTVSNRLNVVMKQLTIIATVFLPLTFLTGFFGQNFGWLVGHIAGFWVFMIAGVAVDLLASVGLLYVFKRRGWLGGPSA
jgi:magnesium transporter